VGAILLKVAKEKVFNFWLKVEILAIADCKIIRKKSKVTPFHSGEEFICLFGTKALIALLFIYSSFSQFQDLI